jgi:hypothetical protein
MKKQTNYKFGDRVVILYLGFGDGLYICNDGHPVIPHKVYLPDTNEIHSFNDCEIMLEEKI